MASLAPLVLVGARGTARHALFLGAVVTFTHTVGVFLLGLAVLFLSGYIVPERLYPWIGFLSGAMILGVGVNLFRQRFSKFTHDHGHGEDGHTHEIPGDVTLRNLFALGFSGGIVAVFVASVGNRFSVFGVVVVELTTRG